MKRTTIVIALILASALMAVSANLHTMGVRNVRLIANHHRNIIGQHLLDLNTGLPVVCDTDTDCYRKTGINY